MPQVLDEGAGVDVDRAGDLATAVARACLYRVVVVVRQNRRQQGRRFRLAGHLAPQRNSLSRRRREIATRTDRLAEPALDAAIDGRFDDGRRLKVLEVTFGVVSEDDPGDRMFCGSASRFSSRISPVSFGPHSRSTKGATLRPVPCSALSEPSYLPTTSSTTSCMKRPKCAMSFASFRNGVIRKCRLPAEAWPKTTPA